MSRSADDTHVRFAKSSARFFGRPRIFVLTVIFIILWALAGPMFGFSKGWQLVINMATNAVTFFMVFLIQNTQNRDTEALHVKLDEIRDRYREIARQARANANSDCPGP